MKIFKVYSNKNVLTIVLIIVLSIALSLLTINLTDVTRQLYNNIEAQCSQSEFLQCFIIFIILLIIIFIISNANEVLDSRLHWMGMGNIKTVLLEKVLLSDYSIFDKQDAPILINNISMVSMQVSQFYKSIILLISKIIVCGMYSYIVYTINKMVCLIVILVLILVIISNLWVNKKLSNLQREIIQQSGSNNQISVEINNSINNIKVKNRYEFFLNKNIETFKKFNWTFTLNSFFLNYWNSLSNVVSNIMPMIIIYVMRFKLNVIEISIGDLIVLYTLIPLMLKSFDKIISTIFTYSSSKPSLEKLKSIMDYPESKLGDEKIDKFDGLELTDVNIKYSDDNIVAIPNMQIKNGEKVLIVGESGKGKSTLFDIVMGIKSEYNGVVKINGKDIKQLDLKSIRKLFGISFQENKVFNMTLEENITLGRKSTVEIQDMINDFVLTDMKENREGNKINEKTVSGGEASRIALAQNLYANPEVILIDESLSSVDEKTEEDIMKNMLQKHKEKTFICISHRKTSAKYFDRVINI